MTAEPVAFAATRQRYGFPKYFGVLKALPFVTASELLPDYSRTIQLFSPSRAAAQVSSEGSFPITGRE